MSDTAPTGPFALAIDGVASLLAASATFQAWAGCPGDPGKAADNVHWIALPRPDDGKNFTPEELANRRPFALVDVWRDGNGLRAVRGSSGGGGEYRYRYGWRMFLYIEADVPPEVRDDYREAEVRFLANLGGVISDMLALAGEDAYPMVSEVAVLEGPNRSDPKVLSSEGDYQYVTLLLQVGS